MHFAVGLSAATQCRVVIVPLLDFPSDCLPFFLEWPGSLWMSLYLYLVQASRLDATAQCVLIKKHHRTNPARLWTNC